jgi:hypothetical protein
MIVADQTVNSNGRQNMPAQQDSEESPENQHPHTLDEIQRRACRIHSRHGAVYGGYTLEEWLEAEHELEHEEHPAPSNNKDRVH